MDIFTLHLLSFDKLFSEKNARNVRQTYRGRTQSRLLASVWSKNKGGGGTGPLASPLDPPLRISGGLSPSLLACISHFLFSFILL